MPRQPSQGGLSADRDDRRGATGREPWGGVEVEELPPRPVLPRGTARPRIGVIFGAGAIVLILAGGLGMLGGRPRPSPASNVAQAPSSTSLAATPAYAGRPYVTPASGCGPEPEAPPGVVLEVNGRPTPGQVDVLEWLGSGSPPPADGSAPTPGGRTDIRSDVIAELWIADGACAVAWQIDAVKLEANVLESVGNPTGDPGFASQNRFALMLAPLRGESLYLQAELTFPRFIIRATWPVHVLPFAAPSPQLTTAEGPVALVEGCDVQLILGSGWTEQVHPCSDDLAADPGTSSAVGSGEKLTFSLWEGWQIETAMVDCGQLEGLLFVAGVEPGCAVAPTIAGHAFSFALPEAAAAETLALSACAGQYLADVTNRICGTWYATVRTAK